MSNDTPALIEIEQLAFRYRRADEAALHDISLEIRAGEVLLIAGPSGCGKSTLLRCINGLIPRAYTGQLTGSIRVLGRDAATMSLAEIGQVIGTVLQDPERQIVASHVFEEVAFGLENQGLPRDQIRARVRETLAELQMLHLAAHETFALSGGEKQKLAIAGVLVLRPQILILDEPLANLDPASAQEALRLCRRLADAGRAVVIVEHRVEEVLSIEPERVVLMDEGRVIFDGPGQELGDHADPQAVKLPAAMALRALQQRRAARPAARPPAAPDQASLTPLIALRAVEFGYDQQQVLRGVDLTIYAGDRIALLGPNGSGKSTLVKHMIGLLRPQRGEIWLAERPLAALTVAQAARQVGYVFQSPSHMLFGATVAEELAFGPRNLGQSPAEIAAHSSEALALMNLTGMEQRPPLTLSFGQQRRLCIASVIAMRAGVLLMDEPTAGQDYRSYMQFMDGIVELGCFAAQVFITHDLDLAIGYANRVVLLDDGRVAADGPPHEVLADTTLLRRCRLLPTSLLEENLRRLAQTGRFQRLEHLAALGAAHDPAADQGRHPSLSV